MDIRAFEEFCKQAIPVSPKQPRLVINNGTNGFRHKFDSFGRRGTAYAVLNLPPAPERGWGAAFFSCGENNGRNSSHEPGLQKQGRGLD